MKVVVLNLQPSAHNINCYKKYKSYRYSKVKVINIKSIKAYSRIIYQLKIVLGLKRQAIQQKSYQPQVASDFCNK